jgi:molybdopterin-guanine dinucleotide biosynthesis protein A
MRVDGRLQPLPALYLPADLGALERAMDAGASLRATLRELGPCVLEEDELRGLGDPRRLCFSVNDARALDTAIRWMAG